MLNVHFSRRNVECSSSTIYNTPYLEITEIPFRNKTDKYGLIHSTILCNNKSDPPTSTCTNRDDCHKHDVNKRNHTQNNTYGISLLVQSIQRHRSNLLR